MIGIAREKEEIYYLEKYDSHGQAQQSTWNQVHIFDDIMLLHHRLGHPKFSYLKHVFPDLFKNKCVFKFQYEMCQFAKHHSTTFPACPYQASTPFFLIHNDAWRFKNPTIYRKKWFITFIDDLYKNNVGLLTL